MNTLIAHLADAKESKPRLFFAALLLVNACLISVAVLFLPFTFEENDDVAMLLIASGAYSGAPDSRLVFINTVYGEVLKALYTVMPRVEWYSLAFLVFDVLSLSIVAYFLIRRAQNWRFALLFLGALYAVAAKIVLQLQFTTTAALVALAGVTLLLEKGAWAKVLSVLLLVIASLIRLEAAALCVIVSLPLVAGVAVSSYKVLTNRLIALGVATCCVVAVRYVDSLAYRNDLAWEKFRERTALRGRINDHPNAHDVSEKVRTIISAADYSLLLVAFSDPTIVGNRQLSDIAAIVTRVPTGAIGQHIMRFLRIYWPFVLLFGLLFVTLPSRVSGAGWKCAAVLVWFVFTGILCFLSFNAEVKHRVFVTAALPLVYLGAVIPLRSETWRWGAPSYSYLIVLVLLVCFAHTSFKDIRNSAQRARRFAEQQKLVESYVADSGRDFMPFSDNYRMQFQNPLKISQGPLHRYMVSSGWLAGIPFNEGRFDGYDDLVDSKGLLIHQRSLGFVDLILDSLDRNYGIKAYAVSVAQSGDSQIVEFRRQRNGRGERR